MRFFLILFFLFTLPVFACTVTDDAGNQLNLSSPAYRIISLSPDLTEFVFSLGAGSALVGVISASDYPPAAKKIRRVGDYRALDLETILSLHPDLILAWSEGQRQSVKELKGFSIPVYISHPRQLRDIPQTLRRLGCLTGRQEEAERQAKQFESRYAGLKKKYQTHTPLRVFYEISSQPLMTINQNSWINEAIEICGGKNIFAMTGVTALFQQTAFTVSAEAVVQAKPQLIVADLPAGWEKQWQPWHFALAAMNPDLLDRPGPRVLDGVEALCKIISKAPPSPTLPHKGGGDH